MKFNEKNFQMAMANQEMLIKDLCKKVPISYNALWSIRNGKSEGRMATIGKIAAALNIPVSLLIEEGED